MSDQPEPVTRQAPMPDNKHAGPVPNLKCPLCQGRVEKVPTESQGTIYVAEAQNQTEYYYDDATKMDCMDPECPVDSFYMGCKTGMQSVGAYSEDFRSGRKKEQS